MKELTPRVGNSIFKAPMTAYRKAARGIVAFKEGMAEIQEHRHTDRLWQQAMKDVGKKAPTYHTGVVVMKGIGRIADDCVSIGYISWGLGDIDGTTEHSTVMQSFDERVK